MKSPPESTDSSFAPDANGEPGDTQARARDVASLFHEHNQMLVRFLRARLGSEQEAREVAQEAYVRMLQLDRTGAVGFLRAYIFKVATNLATDRLRSRNTDALSEPVELFEGLQDAALPERTIIAREQLDILLRALDELPRRCRDIFIMHRYQDKSQAQIAEALGLSERTIRNDLVRAVLYCKLRVNGLSAAEAQTELEQ